MSRLCAALSLLIAGTALHAATIEQDFADPPVAARPYVWWHWMGPNFSKEGITKDLEAMRAAGIGGATIFNLTSAVQETQAPTGNNPWPQQTYRSPAYWDAIRHAAIEAERLGLEVGLHNTVGYSTTGGPWIDEEKGMQRLVWKATPVGGGQRVTVPLAKGDQPRRGGWGGNGQATEFYRDVVVLAVPEPDAKDGANSKSTPRDQVLDVTAHMTPDGTLTWDAPPGRWRVYRFGHAPTGASPHPVPDDVMGRVLEADKMDAAVSRHHWSQVIEPLKQHLGEHLGKGLRHFLIDSYEAGYQNWTPGFRDEFRKRKGYDPLPWLACLGAPLTGGKEGKERRVLGSADETARFEWDYRDLIATLYQENGWQTGADMMHAQGVALQFEAYGGPFDTVAGSALADLPMGEFWTGGRGGVSGTVIAAGRAAGRRVIGAEAFTGRPEVSKWTETPAFLKLSADGTLSCGVNRLVLHHWVLQPFADRHQPGMGMGWWGTHFGRNQTWFEPGKAFFRYLGRCQALLQRGETPSDVVSVGKVDGQGDVITSAVLCAGVTVRDGRIALPSGRTYALLSVPHDGALLPEEVQTIARLLEQGAVVVARKPTRSPSLKDFPACDEGIRRQAETLWGDGREVPRKVGRGRLFADGNTAGALATMGIMPAIRVLTGDTRDLRFQHRRDGDADLFFAAHLGAKDISCVVSCGVVGRQPELWNAETGTISDAPAWRVEDGRTLVDLHLGAVKSLFLVFRRATTTTSATAPAAPPAVAPLAVTGPWAVSFASPVDAPAAITMPALASWHEQATAGVKYFSGTATYRTTVTVPASWRSGAAPVNLDLGEVKDLARVAVNGRDCGVVWHPPFIVDISAALRAGANDLAVAVTNTWHNRLVGDEQEPADFAWGKDRGPTMGRSLLEYPEWFLKDQPRPSSGRKCFVIWYYHRTDTPLLPAGLLGPVRLVQ